MERLKQHKSLWILAVLILVTVAVRVPGAYSRSIWYDESITLLETAGNAAPTWPAGLAPASTPKQLLVGNETDHNDG